MRLLEGSTRLDGVCGFRLCGHAWWGEGSRSAAKAKRFLHL